MTALAIDLEGIPTTKAHLYFFRYRSHLINMIHAVLPLISKLFLYASDHKLLMLLKGYTHYTLCARHVMAHRRWVYALCASHFRCSLYLTKIDSVSSNSSKYIQSRYIMAQSVFSCYSKQLIFKTPSNEAPFPAKNQAELFQREWPLSLAQMSIYFCWAYIQ